MAAAATLNPSAPEFSMPGTNFDPEAPVFKPLSDITMRADAAEFIPTLGGYELQKLAEVYSQKHKRQMPPATEEEWETRISKREKEVATIKSLQSYRLYVEVFPPDQRTEEDPKTPDPRDKTVSKRMWKWNVEKWRLQLKSRCVYSRTSLLQFREYVLQQEQEEVEVSQITEGGPVATDNAAGGMGAAAVGEAEASSSLPFLGHLRTAPVPLGSVAATIAVAAEDVPRSEFSRSGPRNTFLSV
mmetsp:Transcript_77827/g.252230  ORF Transcript_77827/g.252230 Transcript_77827/m.252230 type:complete len:243 (+) Transcript_77827:153-881(+)